MEAKKIEKDPRAEKKEKVKRKTLEDLFFEPCAVSIQHAHVHQASELPGTTQNSLTSGRPGLGSLELVYHPGYGVIGYLKGNYFLCPAANVALCKEVLWKV